VPHEPILVSKARAASLLSISEDTFERAVMADVRTVRIGRRVLFAVADLRAWVERHSAFPLVSEMPVHACQTGRSRSLERRSLRPRRRGIVDRTTAKRGDAGLPPAPRP
jgi:hypothetical protein